VCVYMSVVVLYSQSKVREYFNHGDSRRIFLHKRNIYVIIELFLSIIK